MSRVKFLTVSDVAARKGITERQVQRLAKFGVLPVAARGPRNSYLFRAGEIRYAPVSLKNL